MSHILVQGALVATVILLLSAFIYLETVHSGLRPSRRRTAWIGSALFLFLAASGCIVFLRPNFEEGSSRLEAWVVAFTVLASAGFVGKVCFLSHSIAMDIARIPDLERAAYVDPLTRLYTRGRIDSLFEAEIFRCRRDTAPVSVMMLDVDDLKFINDCFGRQAGDKVLEQVGEILTAMSGPLRFVGRYGGEEFLVILPNTMTFHAADFAERICSAIAAKNLRFDEEIVAVTASIGVATSTTFRETSDQLIAAADRALYLAKLAGRNKALHSENIILRTPVSKAETPT